MDAWEKQQTALAEQAERESFAKQAASLVYPLPLYYDDGFQIDEITGIFHEIESFEENGATHYVVLSGRAERDKVVTTIQERIDGELRTIEVREE